MRQTGWRRAKRLSRHPNSGLTGTAAQCNYCFGHEWSKVVPHGAVKDSIPIVPGTKQFTQPPDDMEPVMLLTMEIVAPVAEKIARGLEFKLTGRYIQPPLSIKTFIVPADKVHDLDDVFDGSAELQFGPGCKILRAIPHDNEVIAMYRIVIWKTLLIDVAIGRFAEKGSC